MQEFKRWNRACHAYEPHLVPDNWKCITYTDNMSEPANCAQCGRVYSFGKMYTSLEIHTNFGVGYAVCPECFWKEYARRREAKEQEKAHLQ